VKSNLTIAGQTAPGDGIGIMGREVSFDAATNVIVRNMRFRQGDLDPDSSKSGINLLRCEQPDLRPHLDRVRAVEQHRRVKQQCNHDQHHGAKFHQRGPNRAAIRGTHGADRGLFHLVRQPLGQRSWRLPLAKCNTQYVNNVVYNYQYAYCAGNTSGTFWHDIIHNYFIAGPSTNSPSDDFYQMDASQTVYINGNLLDSNTDGTLNGTDAGYPGGTTHATTANSADTALMPTTSAADTYTAVLANAGASPTHRDQVDSLVIADVKSLGKIRFPVDNSNRYGPRQQRLRDIGGRHRTHRY